MEAFKIPKQSVFRTRRRVSKTFDPEKGRTETHHKDSCDIKKIMKKSEKTGIIEHVSRYQGSYGDFSDSRSFQEHMNEIIKAEEMFESVPSKIRHKFGNDPGAFVDFMTDDANYERIVEMGLDASHLKAPETHSKGESDNTRKVDPASHTQTAEKPSEGAGEGES